MAGGLEINQLIMETIHEKSPNETVVQLILDSLQYELDIWNRYVPKSEILRRYELIVEENSREIIE